MEDVNDQPPHQHPDRHGAVSTRLAANSIPPRAGPPGWRLWAATLARLLLAAVWAWAALAKISDPDAAVRAVRAYQLLPEALVRPVAWGLPFAELVLAVLLAVGLATRLAAAGSAVLLGLFMVAIAAAWARGLQIHCGCFGGGGPQPPLSGPSSGWGGVGGQAGPDRAALLGMPAGRLVVHVLHAYSWLSRKYPP